MRIQRREMRRVRSRQDRQVIDLQALRTGTITLSDFHAPRDLFDLLRTVRTRRVGYGYRVDSGLEEQHPVTGRTMRQTLGPRSFVSQHEPLPLSSHEEALIAWAGLGPNGIVAWEASLGAGFDQFSQVLGRTAPEPNNTLATDLVLINDDGASIYRPTPEPRAGSIVADERETFLAQVQTWYDDGRIRLTDSRPDIDWCMRDPGAPEAMLNGSHQYNLNRPGSTWFLPLTDAGRLQSGLPDLLARRRHYLIDDLNDGCVVGGQQRYVDDGSLVRPMSLSAYEQGTLLTSAYPAGAIVQNIRLACEALGLGAWSLSGYDQGILLGMRPDLGKGIGFSRAGLAGVKEATCAPSPWYADGAAVVAAWRAEREGPGGWAHADALRTGEGSPFAPEVARALAAHDEAHPPDWAWQATADHIDYCIETHGRWPVTYEPLLAGFSVIVHHLDTEYYDRFHQPGLITERIRNHDRDWHA